LGAEFILRQVQKWQKKAVDNNETGRSKIMGGNATEKDNEGNHKNQTSRRRTRYTMMKKRNTVERKNKIIEKNETGSQGV
jgi:hypothetical protein